MIYVLLANGFEEMEAVAPIDLLRRAKCDVRTVAVGDSLDITGAHGITFRADVMLSDVTIDGLQAVVLPGGLPGTTNLEQSEGVAHLIDHAVKNGLVLGAICAAPSILGKKGILNGKCATCYPGFEEYLSGAIVNGESVVVDGNIVTAKGAGVADEFALALIGVLVSEEMANTLREGIQCK